MHALTALKVQKASYPEGRKGPLLLSDGGGLYLQIMPKGSKSWVYRFMIRGKARTMGLGSFIDGRSSITLAQARELASNARSLVAQGIDPLEARHQATKLEVARRAAEKARSVTFEEAAAAYLEAQSTGWRSAKHGQQWVNTLKTYAYPLIGFRTVQELDADAVEAVLRPIWTRIPETASRLRGRIEVILDFAKSKGWREGENPARWQESMKHRLPSVSRLARTAHHPALPWDRIPDFIMALKQRSGMSGLALQFCIFTAARSGEVRGATWSEIDFERGIWTIPGSRMKTKREHRVPISNAALAVLTEALPFCREHQNLIFTNARGTALSDMALSMLVRRMNEEAEYPKWVSQDGRLAVVHGFRSTFRDWCEEATSTPHAVSEAALAHVVADKVEAAYRRTDLFEARKVLMQKWADHCLSR
jgi:integrase